MNETQDTSDERDLTGEPTWTRYCDACDDWHEPGNCPKDAFAPCNRQSVSS